MRYSVIIPTRNRSSLLALTLESLAGQSFPGDQFEVIVVDNGSTDDTRSVVASFRGKIRNLNYIFEPRPGLHEGRHAGLRAAQGDILVYGDDDIIAFPTWIAGIAESFADPSVVLVGGNNLPRYESPPPEWTDAACEGEIGPFSLINLGTEAREIAPGNVYGCNFSIRKEVLIGLGGFHPDSMPDELVRFRGDGETSVTEKIHQNSYRAVFNPKASVWHWVLASRMTPRYLYKRGYLQGISNSYTAVRNRGSWSLAGFCLFYVRYALQNLVFKKISGRCRYPYNCFYRGSLAGFAFHQRACFSDPALVAWVLKKDYLGSDDEEL